MRSRLWHDAVSRWRDGAADSHGEPEPAHHAADGDAPADSHGEFEPAHRANRAADGDAASPTARARADGEEPVEPRPRKMMFVNIAYQGDATDSEAIDRQKVHLGQTSTTTILPEHLEACGASVNSNK